MTAATSKMSRMVLLYMLTLSMVSLPTSLAKNIPVKAVGNQRGNDYSSPRLPKCVGTKCAKIDKLVKKLCIAPKCRKPDLMKKILKKWTRRGMKDDKADIKSGGPAFKSVLHNITQTLNITAPATESGPKEVEILAPPKSGPTEDSGSSSKSGPKEDSGSSSKSGPKEEPGSSPKSGPKEASGSPSKSGPKEDPGSPSKSGPKEDSGSPSKSGPTEDSGSPEDLQESPGSPDLPSSDSDSDDEYIKELESKVYYDDFGMLRLRQ